jgi:hypothetical protein
MPLFFGEVRDAVDEFHGRPEVAELEEANETGAVLQERPRRDGLGEPARPLFGERRNSAPAGDTGLRGQLLSVHRTI